MFLRCQSCMSHMGVLLYYQWPGFHQVIWGGLQIFYYKFFWFATSFPIFKLLNSMVVNLFKVIKKCLCYSSSLRTGTEAAYENYKLWREIKHIVVSRDDCKQKMVTCWEQSTWIVSYIMWWMKIFWVCHFYFIDKLSWNLKRN